MATTTATETKTLVNYRAEDGIAVIELSDPPANTYTYEMNRQLDDCILKARGQALLFRDQEVPFFGKRRSLGFQQRQLRLSCAEIALGARWPVGSVAAETGQKGPGSGSARSCEAPSSPRTRPAAPTSHGGASRPPDHRRLRIALLG